MKKHLFALLIICGGCHWWPVYGDWNIGVRDNRIFVLGNSISPKSSGPTWSPTNLYPAAWWVGDSTNDASGNGNGIVMSGSDLSVPLFTNVPGLGYAFEMDAADLGTARQWAARPVLMGTVFSVSMWVFHKSTPAGVFPQFFRQTDDGDYGVACYLYPSDSVISQGYAHSEDWYELRLWSAPSVNTLLHLVVVADSSTYKAYTNGVLATTLGASDGYFTVAAELEPFVIGGAGQRIRGYYRNIVVFNRALSTNEVVQLYQYR